MDTLGEVLDDLLIRFILNCPEEEHQSTNRLFFQIEEAYWYYLDFYRETCKTLPDLKFKDFVDRILQRFPPLGHYRDALDAHTKSFYDYKFSVPVCGAVIMNKDCDKILLVKGWSNKSSWSFPRGKINRFESEFNCAIREVFEETGFDISMHGAKDDDFIELSSSEQKVKLFIVSGVDEKTIFTPQTRKEISACKWHSIEELTHQKKNSGKFWVVLPYMHKINLWLAKNRTTNSATLQKSVQKKMLQEKKQFSNQITILKRERSVITNAAA